MHICSCTSFLGGFASIDCTAESQLCLRGSAGLIRGVELVLDAGDPPLLEVRSEGGKLKVVGVLVTCDEALDCASSSALMALSTVAGVKELTDFLCRFFCTLFALPGDAEVLEPVPEERPAGHPHSDILGMVKPITLFSQLQDPDG